MIDVCLKQENRLQPIAEAVTTIIYFDLGSSLKIQVFLESFDKRICIKNANQSMCTFTFELYLLRLVLASIKIAVLCIPSVMALSAAIFRTYFCDDFFRIISLTFYRILNRKG